MRIFIGRSRLVRRAAALAATLAVAGFAGPLATTAHASTTGNCGANFTMTCAGTFVHVEVVAGTEQVSAPCTAVAPGTAATTGVHCYLQLGTNPPVNGVLSTAWEPGSVSTTDATFGVAFDMGWELCVEGAYMTRDGDFNDFANPVCGQIIT